MRYQEIDLTNEDLEVRVDHFWNKIFNKTDESGDSFIILSKMVKYALVLCHSNADVERLLSVNKRMLTKQNVAMNDETVKGLKAIKDEIKHAGGIRHYVTVSLDMVKAAENSRSIYYKYLNEEKRKKEEKEKDNEEAPEKKSDERKRKREEIVAEKNRLYEKLQEYREKEEVADEKRKKGLDKVKEGNAISKVWFHST